MNNIENTNMKIGINYIGTSAGAVIANSKRKLFLAQRGKEARDDIGKWEFPGGAIDFFETREEAAVRNVLEKYSIDIEIDKLLGIYDVIDKVAGDHWISTTYLCKYLDGEPTINFPQKCQNVGWFSLEEISKMDLSRITRLNFIDIQK